VDWNIVLGPLGLTAVMTVTAAYLARLHLKEDAAREARLVATEAREDVLVGAVRDSTLLLKDLKDQEAERLAREQAYDGPERRGRR